MVVKNCLYFFKSLISQSPITLTLVNIFSEIWYQYVKFVFLLNFLFNVYRNLDSKRDIKFRYILGGHLGFRHHFEFINKPHDQNKSVASDYKICIKKYIFDHTWMTKGPTTDIFKRFVNKQQNGKRAITNLYVYQGHSYFACVLRL